MSLHRSRCVGLVRLAIEAASLACFAAGALLTVPHGAAPSTGALAPLATGVAGGLLMSAAGWSGWALVARHRVGVAALVERAVRPRPVRVRPAR